MQLKANHMGTDNRKKNLHQLLASMLNAALCIYTGGGSQGIRKGESGAG